MERGIEAGSSLRNYTAGTHKSTSLAWEKFLSRNILCFQNGFFILLTGIK
jgi:hypothetical protein